MSNLFAVSFDVLCSPTLAINENKLATKVEKGNGWGVGWYPKDGYAASVVKDIVVDTAKAFSNTLSNWESFRSSLFLIKMMNTKKTYNQTNAQPFQKSLGGREWIFIHRGDLDKKYLGEIHSSRKSAFEPLGTTDSEIMFCIILEEIYSKGIKRIGEMNFLEFNGILKNFNDHGKSDYLLTDGQSLLIYADKFGSNPLFYKRILPPHGKDIFKGNLFSLAVQDHAISNRTAFMVSTSAQESDEGWVKLNPGQMLVVRNGKIIWNSHGDLKYPIEYNQLVKSEMRMNETVIDIIKDKNIDDKKMVLNIKAITETKYGNQLYFKKYKITHTTNYQYENPIEKSTHTLRLQPVDDQIQALINSTLNLSVNCEQVSYDDVFGNQAVSLSIAQPYKELNIVCESIVKIFQRPPDEYSFSLRRPSIPINWMPWQRQMMLPYLLPPELPESELLELYNFAMSFAERNDYELLPILQDMNKQIFEDFTYQSGSTNIETTPFEVLTTRKGVCQDFANLLICMARILGVPARYQVGYIHTGTDYQNTIQAEASHAWVELYLPYIGWRGFDPTNGCMVGQDHIRVACGRHYRDATPTAGTIFIGDGSSEKLSVSVKVEELTA